MKQEERWDYHCKEITDFINTNKRRPSKYREEELQMVYWMKYCRKLINRGQMSDARKEKFKRLMDLASKFQRKNQYEYTYVNEKNVGITLEKGRNSR